VQSQFAHCWIPGQARNDEVFMSIRFKMTDYQVTAKMD